MGSVRKGFLWIKRSMFGPTVDSSKSLSAFVWCNKFPEKTKKHKQTKTNTGFGKVPFFDEFEHRRKKCRGKPFSRKTRIAFYISLLRWTGRINYNEHILICNINLGSPTTIDQLWSKSLHLLHNHLDQKEMTIQKIFKFYSKVLNC